MMKTRIMRIRIRIMKGVKLFSVSLCLCGVLSAAEPVRYTISLREPAKHYLHVAVRFRADGPFELEMPVWNATYQVRDFALYVEGLRASAPIRRLNTRAWLVTPRGGDAEISYDVYADRPGPFGLQLNERHAFLNFALCLIYPVPGRNAPVELRFTDIPAGWKLATALPEEFGVFRARNFDQLADSPVEISPFQEVSLREGPAAYRIVVDTESKNISLPKLESIVRRIVAFETALMRDVPFRRYTFLYHLRPQGGGGMEHAESTAIDSSPPESEGDERGWERLESVTAHEFFHLWNVKRVRPQSLEPVNYAAEQPTRALWFSEGFTSTYGTYTQVRTGMISPERFLRRLERSITDLEKRPALRRQSLEESSLETWYDKYPYYRRPERSISYYQKGELVGYLLDLAIRQATENRRSLDDLMRWINERFAHQGVFFDEDRDIQRGAEELTGKSFQGFFDTLVRSAAPVDYTRYFAYAGLELQEKPREVAALGFTASRSFEGPVVVSGVDSTGPAAGTALRVGDTVLEINRRRIGGRDFEQAAGELKPGHEVRLRLERDGRQFEARFSAGRTTERTFQLKENPKPSPLELKIRKGWLEGKVD